jgi:hypothetical protein
MENAQAHRFRGAPGHCLMGLATSGQWGCFTLFYSLRKPLAGVRLPVPAMVFNGIVFFLRKSGCFVLRVSCFVLRDVRRMSLVDSMTYYQL